MKIVWKIFELQELSVNNQWDMLDVTCHVLVEWTDEFDSEEEAIERLVDDSPKDVELIIRKVIKFK